MSNAEYILQLMAACPYIAVSPLELHLDQVDANGVSYSIEGAPNAPTLKRYLNGDTLRVFAFALIARRGFLTDDERKANSEAYDQMALWMDRQTKIGSLPAMGAGKRPIKLQATGSGYVLEQADDSNTALYAMQAQLIYYQEA